MIEMAAPGRHVTSLRYGRYARFLELFQHIAAIRLGWLGLKPVTCRIGGPIIYRPAGDFDHVIPSFRWQLARAG